MTTDDAALANLRADALSLAVDLEDAAMALRQVAAGQADAVDVALVRGLIDAHGDLVVRGCLDWWLLTRFAIRVAP